MDLSQYKFSRQYLMNTYSDVATSVPIPFLRENHSDNTHNYYFESTDSVTNPGWFNMHYKSISLPSGYTDITVSICYDETSFIGILHFGSKGAPDHSHYYSFYVPKGVKIRVWFKTSDKKDDYKIWPKQIEIDAHVWQLIPK